MLACLQCCINRLGFQASPLTTPKVHCLNCGQIIPIAQSSLLGGQQTLNSGACKPPVHNSCLHAPSQATSASISKSPTCSHNHNTFFTVPIQRPGPPNPGADLALPKLSPEELGLVERLQICPLGNAEADHARIVGLVRVHNAALPEVILDCLPHFWNAPGAVVALAGHNLQPRICRPPKNVEPLFPHAEATREKSNEPSA